MTDHSSRQAEDRPILPDERSGVLLPDNLERYAANWIAPAAEVDAVVDQFWHVSWAFPDGESADQRIIDLPAVTVTIEDGDTPAPLVVTGVQTGAWRRMIHGRGRVFAIRLRPAGLAIVSDLAPSSVRDATIPVTPSLDARLYEFMREVATTPTPAERARSAERVVAGLLIEQPVSEKGLLANAVLDELRARVRHRTGTTLPQHFGVSERTVERALMDTVGHGPKWISRRIRLQEVALALATRPDASLAAIAAELGYADQSHLTADFRAVAGITPGGYRRRLTELRAR
ncbi:helix-turn-helix domain-containing protein [Agromyces bauzanensis]|uniref:AraC family transcriptional regulator n=1 Tax=Agromyces bauzanensis TaxID=1308924 RepID=A0A917P9J5_9MICO|nr:helix-turn-helix domain-containing protein [Agromyces bauzanensis]GGJ67502.1 AraC family transcriptional regulator [Agromyces bauzanensis]